MDKDQQALDEARMTFLHAVNHYLRLPGVHEHHKTREINSTLKTIADLADLAGVAHA